MINWINRNKESLIRVAFLIPILAVSAISISHVVSWYNLANPISWAIYLSIAVEVAAMSAIAASSVRIKGFSIWFVFIIVTAIQFIGNIYFSYTEIDINSAGFKDWADLTFPLFDSFSDTTDISAQRRLLAILEGGLLPLISLTCLHFFIKYGDIDNSIKSDGDLIETEDQSILEDHVAIEDQSNTEDQNSIEEKVEESIDPNKIWERVTKLREKGQLVEPSNDDKLSEPTALAFTQNETDIPSIDETVIFTDSPEDKTSI